jgi:hypothetical protein
MWSTGNEYVPFFGEFAMAGAVENFICDLERCMQTTFRDVLDKAIQAADLWDIENK